MHIFCFVSRPVGSMNRVALVADFPIVLASSKAGARLIHYSNEVYLAPGFPNHLRKSKALSIPASTLYHYCQDKGIVLNDYEKSNVKYLLEEINNMTKEEKKELWKKRCF